jgi:hypothetical protein
MTRDRDDVLAELAALVNVEPRAGFTARTRAAVTRDREARTARRSRRVASITAAVAAVVLAVLYVPRSAPAPIEPASSTPTGVTSRDVPLTPPSSGVAQPDAPPARGSQDVDARRGRGGARQVAVTRVGPREIEVVIDPRQAVLLRAVIEQARAGEVVLPPSLGRADGDEPLAIRELQEPAPVVISEITIDPLPGELGS